MNISAQPTGHRSPVPAILGSLAAGVALAIALVVGPASGGTEPVVTGSVLLAFGFGWGLMAFLSTRFSAQPQPWMAAPAAALGLIGLLLTVLQPGPAAMDVMSWVWPPALAVLAIWMVRQIRSGLRGRGRWLVVPVTAALLVCAIGGGLATVSTATGPGAAVGPGRLIDVGGHRLYIECTGSGGPVVVLQSGLLESSAYWSLIAPAGAASTPVCVYDRAGHGRSDEAGPQDGIALATDLHTLLERAGVAGPYVMVGHSSGGPYVRVFVARYPDQIAGMVVLDGQPADAFHALPEYPAIYQGFRFVSQLSPTLARVNLLGIALGLPADQSTPASARNARDEVVSLPAALEQSGALTSLGDRPVVIVSAPVEAMAGWLAAQDRMTAVSTNAVHRVIAGATHNSLISGADAGASIQAILDVVAAVRTMGSLR